MNASQPARSRADSSASGPAAGEDAIPEEPRRSGDDLPAGSTPEPPSPEWGWRTQERISRCRGLDYCVIEVHEFDLERPQQRPPNVEYRVYADAHGFPVGEALASFPTREAAQRHAEALTARRGPGSGS